MPKPKTGRSCQCVICGVHWTARSFISAKGSWRGPEPSKYCGPECKAKARPHDAHRWLKSRSCSCVMCGIEWCTWSSHSVQSSTCSKACEKEHRKLERITREDGRAWHSCEECAVRFRLTRTIGKKGYTGRFCGKPCYFTNFRRKGLERQAVKAAELALATPALKLQREIKNTKQCSECSQIFQATHENGKYCSEPCSTANTLRQLAARKQKEQTCKVCRVKFFKTYKQGWAGFCSKPCQQARARELKRAYRMKGKAMRRGARRVGIVLREAIWRRDQGLCGLCGIPVKRNAEVTDPRAMEIDHIIPISKGGAHVIENLQIACRSCNAWKSDKDLCIGGVAA